MNESPESIDLFQQIDFMVNAFDSEGAGPLRKGEQPFSWATVETLATPLAQSHPDLRVGIWLLRAQLAQHGLPGLRTGLERIAQWMKLPAEQLRPLGDPGESPRELHALLLRWLTMPGFVASLQEAHLFGPLSPSVHSLFDDKSAPSILAEIDPSRGEALMRDVRESSAMITLIDELLSRELPGANLPFEPLQAKLGRIALALRAKFTIHAGASNPPLAEASPLGSSTGSPNILLPAAHVTSREHVHRSIAELIEYFDRYEPGHPAPIFFKRIQRMLGANFEELLEELYPEAGQLVAKLNRPVAN